MHASQFEHMKRAVETYVPRDRRVDVVELGSATSPGQRQTHRRLFADREHSYFGVDIRPGPDVDAVMRKPYTIPARSRSADVVICGSVLEHVPFFWASAFEMARVLRPDGYLFITVPSRGNKHSPIDCWRMYPDGLRTLGVWSGLTVIETHTHFPPRDGKRHAYGRIDTEHHYWGDSVAVFRKPAGYPLRMRALGLVTRATANHLGRRNILETTPRPVRGCDVLRPTTAHDVSNV